MNILSSLYSIIKKKGKVGITLSGGGVRGIAHLGVLKALNEKKIYPDMISGVSAGALAGAFYADGYKPDEIFEIFNEKSVFKFAKISMPRKGFLSMAKVEKILKDHLKAKDFKELKTPLYIAASNLNKGKIEYFSEGTIIDKVIASASIPVLFKPVEINGNTYVDGGVFDNLPVKPILNKCEMLIGSNVSPLSTQDEFDGMLDIAERSFHLAIGKSVKANKELCDIFIEPLGLTQFGILKLEKAREIYEIGYEEALKQIEDL